MVEYIDRQAAIKAIEGLHDCYNGFSDTYDKACIIGVLEEIAPADVEPVKHGRWEVFYAEELCGCKHAYYVCSNCFNSSDDEFDYCPNCGASMDGEQDDGKGND